MKKILYLIFLLPVLVFGQETKSQLTTRFDVIRNETAVGGNTKTRIANAYQELADGTIGVYPVTASGTDTYTGSLVGVDAYSGRIVFVVFTNGNTGAATFNLNSIGATQIRKYSSGWVALSSGDIVGGKLYRLYNDGTYWQIDLGGAGDGTPGGSDTQVQFNDGGAFNGEAEFTYNKTDNVVKIHKLSGDATDGLIVEASGGTDVGILGAGNTANATWYGSHNYDAATANTIASFGASKTLSSLSTATYPSLTELSYVKGLSSAIQTQLDAKANEALTIDTKTDDYTLVLTDKDSKLIEMNDATGNDVTVPLNSSVAFPVGTTITIVQKNTEQCTIVATGGVTINSSSGTLDGPGQNAAMVLVKTATDTWYLFNGTAGGGGVGTVTSVAVAAGTTGTDVNVSGSPITTSGTITFNIPTASGTNRGALSSTDWTTFNNKQSAISFGTGVQTALGVNIGSAGAPVLFNGAGGTPSSLTLTNADGLPLSTGVTGTLGTANGGTGSGTQTASRIAIYDGSSNLVAANTATYPNLTELAYIKGLKGTPTRYSIYENTTAQTCNVTAETIMFSFMIQGGTITATDRLVFEILYGKNGATDSYNARIKYNTSNTLVGATQIAIANPAASLRYMKFIRTMTMTSLTSQLMFNTTASGNTDEVTLNTEPSTTSIDFNNDVYFFITVNMGGTTDTVTAYSVHVSVD